MIRTATLHLDTPAELSPEFVFDFVTDDTGLPVDLTSVIASLEIFENNMVPVFETDSGIGGALTILGSQLKCFIDNASFAEYFENIKSYPNKRYRYSLTLTGGSLGDGLRLQGWWRSLIKAGPVVDTGDTVPIRVGTCIITVSVAGGTIQQAEFTRIRSITGVDGSLNADDETLVLRAAGADISFSLPSPATIYSDGLSPQIVVLRAADDVVGDVMDGSVAVNGIGPELPEILYPGESMRLQSDGTDWHVID